MSDEGFGSIVARQELQRFNGVRVDPLLEIAGQRDGIERGRSMPEGRDTSASDVATPCGRSATSPCDRDRDDDAFQLLGKSPCLRVRSIDGHSVVDVLNAEILFDSDMIQNLSSQLHRLVEEGHSCPLLNLSDVRYMSSDVLGTLAVLHRQVDRANGRLALCGLNPMLRQMMRICCLERVVDIYANESEALGTSRTLGDGIALE